MPNLVASNGELAYGTGEIGSPPLGYGLHSIKKLNSHLWWIIMPFVTVMAVLTLARRPIGTRNYFGVFNFGEFSLDILLKLSNLRYSPL